MNDSNFNKNERVFEVALLFLYLTSWEVEEGEDVEPGIYSLRIHPMAVIEALKDKGFIEIEDKGRVIKLTDNGIKRALDFNNNLDDMKERDEWKEYTEK